MKAVAIWKDHTHVMPDLSPWLAEVHLTSLLVDGVEGQIPVAAFVVPDWATYAVQSVSGDWYALDAAPVRSEKHGASVSQGREEVVFTGQPKGWWTDTLFNLEK